MTQVNVQQEQSFSVLQVHIASTMTQRSASLLSEQCAAER